MACRLCSTATQAQPPPPRGDNFGGSIAATERLIAVAEPGAVHLFVSGSFLRTLVPDPEFSDPRVAILGDQIIVGEGSALEPSNLKPVFIFEAITGDIIQTLFPYGIDSASVDFGAVVALTTNVALVAAPRGDGGPGRLYGFDIFSGVLMWRRGAPFSFGDDFVDVIVIG